MVSDQNEKNSNQSVVKLLQLMTCLSESRTTLRLQEIAGNVRMPQATVLRYLNSLIQEGYAYQDSLSGRYALTWKISNIGERVRMHMNLRAISGDIVNTLASEIDFGICLVIEQEMECFYLDCIYEPTSIGFSLVRIGKQTPMHASGSGKVLLSAYSDGELEDLIAKKGLPRLTEKTITTKRQLIQELEEIRQRGYALDDEECEPGLRCVSVPIYGEKRKIIAAISAFGAAGEITETSISDHILPKLKVAANQISFRCGAEAYGGAELRKKPAAELV